MKLAEVAREAIKSQLKGEDFKPDKEVRNKYSKKKASFVTITNRGVLRGCIGTVEPPGHALWKDICRNAVSAAFRDPRFTPIKKSELENLDITVSVLSKPKELKFKNGDSLLKKIDKKMGIIIKKGKNSATFLPQVWKQIRNKKQFLQQLSLKAGLSRSGWKNSRMFYYRTTSMEK